MTTSVRSEIISVLIVVALVGFYNVQRFAKAETTGSSATCELQTSGVCTRDLNACQHASLCECPAGYTYSSATGSCLFNFCATADEAALQLSSSLEPAASDSACVLEPIGICTTDSNLCGHASICQCPDSYTYSAALGRCLKNLQP